MLRRVRTRQGLRLEEVAFRAGLSLEHLNALETATFDRSLDRVAVLRSLRTYANFLGLQGERLVLLMIDLWPGTRAAAATLGATRTGEVTKVPAVSGTSTSTATGLLPATARDTATVPAVGPGHRVTPPEGASPVPITRPNERVPGSHGHPGDDEHTVPVPRVVADTGPVPAVTSPSVARSPLLLRVAVGLVALAVVVGAVGLVIDHYRPSWLRSLGITHTTAPPGNGSAAGGAAGTTHHRTIATTTVPQFTVGATTATGVTLSVRAPAFTAQLVAVGGEAWAEVAAAAGGQPLFAGIMAAGQSQTFTNQHDLVINIGSKAAHLFVSVKGRTVGFYLPQVAPFTIRINGVA